MQAPSPSTVAVPDDLVVPASVDAVFTVAVPVAATVAVRDAEASMRVMAITLVEMLILYRFL